MRLDGATPTGETIDAYELMPEDLKLLHAEDFRDDNRYDEHLRNLVRQLSEDPPRVGKLVAVPELPHPGGREAELHTRLLDAYKAKCSDGWPGGPNDGYFFEQPGRPGDRKR